MQKIKKNSTKISVRLKEFGFYVYINKHGLVFKKVNSSYIEQEKKP